MTKILISTGCILLAASTLAHGEQTPVQPLKQVKPPFNNGLIINPAAPPPKGEKAEGIDGSKNATGRPADTKVEQAAREVTENSSEFEVAEKTRLNKLDDRIQNLRGDIYGVPSFERDRAQRELARVEDKRQELNNLMSSLEKGSPAFRTERKKIEKITDALEGSVAQLESRVKKGEQK